MNKNLICIAKITKPHGVMGDAKLMSYAENPEDVFTYPCVYDEKMTEYKLKRRSGLNNMFVVKLNNNNSRNLIEELAGIHLYITRDMLAPSTEIDQYYHTDLVGLEILDQDNKLYGKIIEVRDFGGGDILEVSIIDKKDTTFIPFLDEFIIEVNMEKKYLIFDFVKAGI